MNTRSIFSIVIFLFSSFAQGVVYEGGTTFLSVNDLNSRPSCDVVNYRLQEYVRRTKEADLVMEWYSPVGQSPAQKKRLLDLLRRMPSLYDDGLYEHLTVRTNWPVEKDDAKKYFFSQKMGIELNTGRFSWSDPFAGTLPEGAKVEMNYLFKVVTLEQKMSFEDFCLSDTDIKLEIALTHQQSVLPEHVMTLIGKVDTGAL